MAEKIPMRRRDFMVGAVAKRLRRGRRATGRPHFIKAISVMTRIAGSTVFFAILTGSADARDMVREVAGVEKAPSGRPYDYIVHVRNVPAIGYNPLVKEDRDRMALQTLRGQCEAGRIVGDDKVITEIWGITSSYPDYIVLVKCRNF
jgi:hypothetical protein